MLKKAVFAAVTLIFVIAGCATAPKTAHETKIEPTKDLSVQAVQATHT